MKLYYINEKITFPFGNGLESTQPQQNVIIFLLDWIHLSQEPFVFRQIK